MDKDKLSPKISSTGNRSPKHERSKSPKPSSTTDSVSKSDSGGNRLTVSGVTSNSKTLKDKEHSEHRVDHHAEHRADHRASPRPCKYSQTPVR